MTPMEDLELTLMAYADGELTPTEVREVEALIAADPSLRAIVEQHRLTTELLRSACAEFFYETGSIRLPQPRRRLPLRQYAGWAIAATVAGILGFGGGTYWAGGLESAHDHLLSEIAEYHAVFSREDKHLVEIPASRTAELTDWLASRVGRPVSAPDLTGLGLTFAGGRMLVVDGKPVAELMYTRANGRPIALCIAEAGHGTTNPGTPIAIAHNGELRLASWQTGAHTFVIVGETDDAAIGAIARESRMRMAG
jgi:anti-sigma factor RsiW